MALLPFTDVLSFIIVDMQTPFIQKSKKKGGEGDMGGGMGE
jgi:hypothetical protein